MKKLFVGDKLRLYYWLHTKSGSGPANLPEIEKGEYGYELQAGQTLFAIRYEYTNYDCFFGCKIQEILVDGMTITSFIPEQKDVFVPWTKEFAIGYGINPKIVLASLYVAPCEALFEKNALSDILSGSIPDETWINDRFHKEHGRGIWHHHGGWRTNSKYEANLKNFIKLGQLMLI